MPAPEHHAGARAGIWDPRTFKVNLIPYNPTSSPYDGSSPKAIAAFRAELERRGFAVTVRLERGREIDAACGQLAASFPRRTTSSQNTNEEVAGLAVSAAHSASSSG